MGKLLDKLANVFRNKFIEYKQTQRFQRIARKTIDLRKEQKSDIERWKNNKELLQNWNERTYLMGNMISDNSKVIEFGSGNMSLKNYLPLGCIYQGSDLIQRSPEIKICDLNEGISLSLNKYDTAVFSGVLEYVYDIENVFDQLKNEIKTVILSYACSDRVSANRLSLGWLSDYSKKELESIFFRNGYEIVEYLEWKKQSIYKLNHI